MSKNQLKTLPALLVLLFSTVGLAAGSPSECNTALLTHIPGSYMSYVQKSEDRRGDSAAKHPEYLNPQKELELVKSWAGESAPELLAPFLPPGVKFIGHSLKKASAPGVVKVEQPGGDFLILRVEMPFKGRTISTNVTVNAQALYANLARYRQGQPLWLIGPDATAALDWGHGGGTKTTGGHTADTMMNYMSKYNVFTIGMDQPFHGGGPREWFEDEMEYFEFRVAFRNRFIHPDVPTFMIGHSFGGQIGDMAVRRSGKGFEALGLKKAYAGIIPLSFVPDASPGSDFEGKMTRSRIMDAEQKWADNEKWINEGDLDLFQNLMAADKCSALSGLQCSQIGLYNNWELTDNLRAKPFYMDEVPSTANANQQTGFADAFKDFLETNPKDLADGPIPSLYFMGEHDALYVLHEENVETYVRRMKNAVLWTVSSRVTFRGNIEKVGHMIFDHYIPKKNVPEATAVMRDFLKKKNAERPVPADEKELQALFKYEVMKDHVKPYSFYTPVNNYSSSLVLMAYQWVPEFTKYLDARLVQLDAVAQKENKKYAGYDNFVSEYFLDYTERGSFETYQVIRDFVAAVLKHKGTELREFLPKDRIQLSKEAGDTLSHSRETIISIVKTYGNNLAFREFLNDLKYLDVPATPDLQTLNKINQDLSQRMNLINSTLKLQISDEEKLAKMDEMGPLTDDTGHVINPRDIEKLKELQKRIYDTLNKKYVPQGENRAFAEANIARRNEIQVQVKSQEVARENLKKKVTQVTAQAKKLEGQLAVLLDSTTSPALEALETKRLALYDDLEKYDLKQRDLLEAHQVNILNTGASWNDTFKSLPPEVQKLFIDTERASQTYQAMLKQIENTKLTEALAGNLGAEAQTVARQLHGEKEINFQELDKLLSEKPDLDGEMAAQMLFGDLGANQRASVLSREVDKIEYLKMAALKNEADKLIADYIQKIMPNYFQVNWISVADTLAQPNSSDESFREAIKALEKGLSFWRARVLVSKPTAEASSLY